MVLQDADGTAHEYTFNVKGVAPGTTATRAGRRRRVAPGTRRSEAGGPRRRPGPGPPDTTAGPGRLEARAGRSHATQTGTRRADGRDPRGAGQTARTASSGGGSTAQGRGRPCGPRGGVTPGRGARRRRPKRSARRRRRTRRVGFVDSRKTICTRSASRLRGTTERRNPSGRQGAGARCRERQSRGIAAGGDRPPEDGRDAGETGALGRQCQAGQTRRHGRRARPDRRDRGRATGLPGRHRWRSGCVRQP